MGSVSLFFPSVGLSPAEQPRADRTENAVCGALAEVGITVRMQWRAENDRIKLCPFDQPLRSVFDLSREASNTLSDGDLIGALKRQLLSLHKRPFDGDLGFETLPILGLSESQGTAFDDPPGYSPARWVRPIFDRELVLAELTESLRERVSRVQVGGTSSGAASGESFEILLLVLGGIGAGLLGAIGKDIWDVIKRAMMGPVKRGPRRTLVEVAMEFEECDVILHAESRDASEIPAMFDDADGVLDKLRSQLTDAKALPQGAETVEIHANSQGGKTSHVLYSYRRARLMMEEIRRATEAGDNDGGE